MRTAANTLWMAAAGHSAELPDLTHPYFGSDEPGDLCDRAKALDEKITELNSSG